MEFKLNEDQQLMKDMFVEFTEQFVKPIAAELDEQERFPEELIPQLGETGLLGIPVAEEYGGAGADNMSYVLAVEEVSKACASTGVTISAHTSLCCWPIEAFGTEESGILITHEHIDHVQGLGVFSRKYEVPIYATKGTIEGIKKISSIGKMPEGLFHEIQTDETFTLGELKVEPFKISHDANEPSGYRIGDGKKSVAVATDLGKYDDYTVEHLKNLDAIVLEANHDLKMLEVGPYPYPLKRRVAGDKGHLSNELSGRLLCDILHDNLKHVVLGHLSKENNYEELAYETVKLEVTLGDNPYKGDDFPITVAKRSSVSEIIDL